MKIVVLCGGVSNERDVSLVTGRNVYEALKERGHQAILLDIYLGLEKIPEKLWEADIDWAGRINDISASSPSLEEIRALRDSKYSGFFGPNVISLCRMADVVFMGLHGADGENGKVQAYFDLEGITYTGTDMLSSALCMNKAIAKELMEINGIPTPTGIYYRRGAFSKEQALATWEERGFPCVIKACSQGSSVGVSIAHNRDEFMEGLDSAFSYDEEVVVEQYIAGREFSICVMEGKALPIIEIAPKAGFYDYKNKYQANSCVETCPAPLSKENTCKMQAYAEKVYSALRLKSYGRIDFLMDNQERMYCLEANTLPGMTATSLVPQEAAAMGISFGELCEKIIKMAEEKR